MTKSDKWSADSEVTIEKNTSTQPMPPIKESSEIVREQAIEAYKEKYNRTPSKLMKTENIIAKL